MAERVDAMEEEDFVGEERATEAGPSGEEATTSTLADSTEGAANEAGGEAEARDENEQKYEHMARVKLYSLNERGHWDDKGTGFASCEYLEVRRTSLAFQFELD